MLLERILQREDAKQFLDDLLDNHIAKPKDKGADPVFVRSYVVQHHWRVRWTRNGESPRGGRSNDRRNRKRPRSGVPG